MKGDGAFNKHYGAVGVPVDTKSFVDELNQTFRETDALQLLILKHMSLNCPNHHYTKSLQNTSVARNVSTVDAQDIGPRLRWQTSLRKGTVYRHLRYDIANAFTMNGIELNHRLR